MSYRSNARRNQYRLRQTSLFLAGALATIVAIEARVSQSLNASGDKKMTTTGLVKVYQGKRIEDIAAIAAGESGYLVTIERTGETVSSPLPAVSEKTAWRFWHANHGGSEFREASESTVVMPVAISVVMALDRNRLTAFALVNQLSPGFLLSWDFGIPPRPTESSQIASPIALSEPEVSMVHVRGMDVWNTHSLPPNEWLFHPNLQALHGDPEVALALNTADGHAVVWTSDGKQKPKAPLVFVPGALNPVFTRVADRNYLLFRRMPENWPMYNHDLRLSGTYGPVALPLMIAEQEAKGSLGQPRDISKEQSLGNVFDFVADSAGDRFVLATVTGTREEPQLQVYVSEGSLSSLHLRHTTRIRQVPYRLTMAIAGDEALIGLAFCQPDGCEVDGMLLRIQ